MPIAGDSFPGETAPAPSHLTFISGATAPVSIESEFMNQPIAVITGASAGIGRATAVAFARRGWRVALLARGVEGLEGARREVQSAGADAFVIPTDVSDYAQVEAAAARVEEEWGPIDAWVNNAMATIFCDFVRIPPEDFKRATEVTY